MAANVNKTSPGYTGHLNVEWDGLYHISQVEGARNGTVKDNEEASDLVWNAFGFWIARIRGDIEQCRNKRVGDINDPISITTTNGLFQIDFPYVLLDAAELLALAGLVVLFWLAISDYALKAMSVIFACGGIAEYSHRL